MGKFNAFMKKRGLLLAAGLCVAAAGVAGVGAINGMIDRLGGAGADSTVQPQKTQDSGTVWQAEIAETPVGKTESGVPKASSSKSGSTDRAKKPAKGASSAAPQSTAPENTAPAESASPVLPRVTRPVAGDVTAHFSGQELL